jgi:hypothetical protein
MFIFDREIQKLIKNKNIIENRKLAEKTFGDRAHTKV